MLQSRGARYDEIVERSNLEGRCETSVMHREALTSWTGSGPGRETGAFNVSRIPALRPPVVLEPLDSGVSLDYRRRSAWRSGNEAAPYARVDRRSAAAGALLLKRSTAFRGSARRNDSGRRLRSRDRRELAHVETAFSDFRAPLSSPTGATFAEKADWNRRRQGHCRPIATPSSSEVPHLRREFRKRFVMPPRRARTRKNAEDMSSRALCFWRDLLPR